MEAKHWLWSWKIWRRQTAGAMESWPNGGLWALEIPVSCKNSCLYLPWPPRLHTSTAASTFLFNQHGMEGVHGRLQKSGEAYRRRAWELSLRGLAKAKRMPTAWSHQTLQRSRLGTAGQLTAGTLKKNAVILYWIWGHILLGLASLRLAQYQTKSSHSNTQYLLAVKWVNWWMYELTKLYLIQRVGSKSAHAVKILDSLSYH